MIAGTSNKRWTLSESINFIVAAYFGSYSAVLFETHSATNIPWHRKRRYQSTNNFDKDTD